VGMVVVFRDGFALMPNSGWKLVVVVFEGVYDEDVV
jgi:hypothetical protein